MCQCLTQWIEDELSRNATVGHADVQGPTQVDSDDEPMVSVGRCTAIDSAMDSPLSRPNEVTQHDPVCVSVSRQATPPPALPLGAHAAN